MFEGCGSDRSKIKIINCNPVAPYDYPVRTSDWCLGRIQALQGRHFDIGLLYTINTNLTSRSSVYGEYQPMMTTVLNHRTVVYVLVGSSEAPWSKKGG